MDLDCLTLNLERMGRYCLKRNSLIDIGRTIWRASRFYPEKPENADILVGLAICLQFLLEKRMPHRTDIFGMFLFHKIS